MLTWRAAGVRQTTYVNGVASSEVRLQTAAVETQKGKAKDEAKKKTKPKNPWQKESEEPTEKEAEKEAEKEKKDDEKKKEPTKKETADEKKARELKERQARELYCLDPAKIALFHSPQSEPEAAGGVEDDARGLYVRYLKIVHFCWNADDVRKQMDALRAEDEELEVVHEAARSQADKFVLESMYHTATPIWFHPAFAAENADVRPAHEPRPRIPPRSPTHPQPTHPPPAAAPLRQAFIQGTGLESGSMSLSLPVLVLTLNAMLKPNGLADVLPLNQRSALATAATLLSDASKLAARLAAGCQPHWGQVPAQHRVVCERAASRYL